MTTNQKGPIYQMVEKEIQECEELLSPENQTVSGNTFKKFGGRQQVIALGNLLPKIQELEPVWIPVGERLPESNCETIVLYQNTSMAAHFFKSENYWNTVDEYGWGDRFIPTHWQPLPQPSK